MLEASKVIMFLSIAVLALSAAAWLISGIML